jgi:hypothetical protein
LEGLMMVRMLSALVLAASVFLAFAGAAAPPDEALSKRPITTDNGEIGKLLKKWWADGTAASNAGDFYDNRDGEHSPLDLRPWPQLRKFQYTPDDFKARRNWALATTTRPHVTFGNSSTSASPTHGGSNVRSYYVHPRGLPFLYEHYTHNNLYIYPEHRDQGLRDSPKAVESVEGQGRWLARAGFAFSHRRGVDHEEGGHFVRPVQQQAPGEGRLAAPAAGGL